MDKIYDLEVLRIKKLSDMSKELLYHFTDSPKDKALWQTLERIVDRNMPMKVVSETYKVGKSEFSRSVDILKCPSCEDEDTIWDRIGDGVNYCGECGQLLDWKVKF